VLRALTLTVLTLTLAACSGVESPPAPADGGRADASGGKDAGQIPDAGTTTDAGTADAGPTSPVQVTVVSDFEAGAQGWTAGFADVPEPPDSSYELESGLRALPAPLETTRQGFMLKSHNRSDDTFMFLTRRLGPTEGLVPNTSYEISFDFDLATNAPAGCIGVGGAPAEAVVLKVGGSTVAVTTTVDSGMRRFGPDQGQQSNEGADSTMLGNISSGRSCPDETYVLVSKAATFKSRVTTSSTGELSVYVGTDSGYEGLTVLYYDRLSVTLTP